MKYYFDCEYSERFKKSFSFLPSIGSFNKKYHIIELISIGIVADDGREYYAVSNEFDPYEVNDWVKENVLTEIVRSYIDSLTGKEHSNAICLLDGRAIEQSIEFIQGWIGKSNKLIASEIIDFVNPDLLFHSTAYNNSAFGKPDSYETKHFDAHDVSITKGGVFYAKPKFYAYYSDYDWVLFCSLFGTMMELPTGFPQYCIDLKQELDRYIDVIDYFHNPEFPDKMHSIKCLSPENRLEIIKQHPDYPIQIINEHNALADARFNRDLHKFINTYLNVPTKIAEETAERV